MCLGILHKSMPGRSYRRRGDAITSMSIIMMMMLIMSYHVQPANTWSLNNLLLTGSQATLALYTDTVHFGAQKGMLECGRQFAYDRWNCPQTILNYAYQNSLPINREIAFVQAIISAGVVHSVSKNCTNNDFDNCPCSNTLIVKKDTGPSQTAALLQRNQTQQAQQQVPKHHHQQQQQHQSQQQQQQQQQPEKNYGNYRWNICSDNIELGSKIAIAFLDDKEAGHDFKAQMRLHNNEVGRRAVKATMLRKCKCHGVSGSCNMKTCWMTLGDFSEVGDYLREAYRNALMIDTNDINGSIRKSLAVVSKSKLVFSQPSPDYCTAGNATVGSIGTLGRQCVKPKGGGGGRDRKWKAFAGMSVAERKSCRHLCRECGYRVKRERRVITTSCNCKFQFCCEVKCSQCTKEEIIYVCQKK